jgi:hypothetical protein
MEASGGIVAEDFATLLRTYRERVGLSANMLGQEVGVDPSYVHRLQVGLRVPPRRHIVEALARRLKLSLFERNRLLLAAGYAPASLVEIGAWTEVLQAVADVLTCGSLTAAEQDAFSQVVCAIAERWRAGAGPGMPRYRAGVIARNGRLVE